MSAASYQNIQSWLVSGQKRGATHMLVVCDTFDYTDYPVFVMPGEDVKKIETEYNDREMSQVMEVYSLSKPIDPQLSKRQNFEY